MTGINLAGMNVKHHRTAFCEHLARHLANQPVRKQTQVAAAKKAHGFSHAVSYGDRHLKNAIAVANAMRIAAPVTNSAMSTCRREDGRIVAIARLRQGIEEPRSVLGGREARSP